jgi:hypothetical protein
MTTPLPPFTKGDYFLKHAEDSWKDAWKMNVEQNKANIMEAIDSLSPKALEELGVFIDFLRFKEQTKAFETTRKIIKLEGLWKDLPFDINDEDIRQARHELTEQLAKRAVHEAEGMSLRALRSNHEQNEAIPAEQSEQEKL